LQIADCGLQIENKKTPALTSLNLQSAIVNLHSSPPTGGSVQ
jgi:hypothetical protein